jgi:hypothetical protein
MPLIAVIDPDWSGCPLVIGALVELLGSVGGIHMVRMIADRARADAQALRTHITDLAHPCSSPRHCVDLRE